jgi:glycosyltransferase involved in cell wall biosynthesis
VTRLRITAILTTHRRPALLLRALRSLAAETRQPDEILVVEDGAEASTAEAVRQSGVPCRLIRQTMGSVSKARNLGLRRAQGDWVIYLDDDDVAYPNRCQELEAAALESGCPLVYGSTLKILPGIEYHVPTHHPTGAGPAGFQDFLRCMPHTNSILFRKADLLACGGFEESSSYFSDWVALLHILDQSPTSASAFRIPPSLAEFKVVPGGMTQDVARDNTMRLKVLEAFDCLRLGREQNREALARVREAVTSAGPLRDYDAYVDLAARHV